MFRVMRLGLASSGHMPPLGSLVESALQEARGLRVGER